MLSNKKNKKGLAPQIITVLIMGFAVLAIMLIVFIFQLAGPPLVSTLQETSGILSDTMSRSNNEVLANATEQSFTPALQSFNNLEWLSYTIFIVMFLTWVIMCYFVRTYPFLLFIWILLMVVIIILSIWLTVVYQDMRVSPGLGEYYQSWENTDFMLKNLPIVMTILAVVGGIVMFMVASRDPEIDGGTYSGGYPL